MGKVMALCGFDGEFEEIWKLAFKAIELTGKSNPNFLIIPTSAFDDYNRGTLNCYHKAGCNVDLLLLTREGGSPETIRQKTEWADMIWVPGGNLKYLKEMWDKTGTTDEIRRAYERGALLFGSSAGSMCWFAEGYDNCAPYDGKMFTPGTGLHPYCICPHFQSENWQSFRQDVRTRKISGIAVEDGAALCLIDGENSVFTSHGTETVRYFDADDGFREYDLKENPGILVNLE